jgi:cyclic-di-GMP-binding protein
MTDAYRRLREGMPEPGMNTTGRFHADPKKVKAWVAALPRANAMATQQELDTALASLSSQRLEGSQRLSVMDELRGVVVESIALLEQQFAGSSLPLPPAKAQQAQHAEMFHLWLAHGYRKSAVEICSPSGSVPMLRGNSVLQCLQRAAWHYSRSLALSWRIYRAPSAGTWQGLHRVHRFASELKLESKLVEDKLAKVSIDIHTLYIQTLLMAVSNPLAFSQAEQDSLWPVARSFAPLSPLLNDPPEVNAPVVPEDADRGPGPGASGESHALWLDVRSFIRETEQALSRQRDGFAELVPGRGIGYRLSVDMLMRLKRAFGLSAARTFKRLQASHSIDTVIGLSGLHYYLAGQRDFDTFMRQASQQTVHVVERASWASVNTDANRLPRIPARVLDQSLGGYRMAWDNANQIRAKVGEIVGMTLAGENEEPDWMVGVVRWLRYEINGGLSAGVELLARRSTALGVHIQSQDSMLRAPLRGIELCSSDSGERSFLTQSSQMDANAASIEIVHGHEPYALNARAMSETLIAGVDVLVNAGDYTVLRELRSDSVAETQQGVEA